MPLTLKLSFEHFDFNDEEFVQVGYSSTQTKSKFIKLLQIIYLHFIIMEGRISETGLKSVE